MLEVVWLALIQIVFFTFTISETMALEYGAISLALSLCIQYANSHLQGNDQNVWY